MDVTLKQLEQAFVNALKKADLATKAHVENAVAMGIKNANLVTKDDLGRVEENIASTVNTAFQQVEDSISAKLGRMERVISSWPAPSAIVNILERVAEVERFNRKVKKKLKIS